MRPIARRIVSGIEDLYLGPNLRLHFDYLEGELGKSEWFVGNEFTAADVQMSFPIEAEAARGDSSRPRPKLAAFLERIHARPAYKRALEKGGPYALLR